MITLKMAIQMVEKKFPDCKVGMCRDYNGSYYCELISRKNPEEQLVDNGYAVNKTSGKIESFSVGSIGYDNLDKYFDSKVVYKI